MNYKEFEQRAKEWNGKTCMFGAGLIGKTWGYEIAIAAGFSVDFYCDNNISGGVTIKNSIKTIGLEELYSYGEDVLVLLTVKESYQDNVIAQLQENQISNIIPMGDIFGQEIYFSIEKENNVNLYVKYRMFMDDAEYLKMRFEAIMGYPLDICNPKTFNEKLNWLKIYERKPEYTRMVDKYAVKGYVASAIGEEVIIPTYGVWQHFEDIEFDNLPEQFVLKTTHDSGGIVICKNKKFWDKRLAKDKLEKIQRYNYYLGGREWPYKNVKPMIIAEQYMSDFDVANGIIGILDYKVHCFLGEPKYIQVIGNRDYINHSGRQLIYDFKWKKQEWSFGDYPKYKFEIPRPHNLELMYEYSKMLACDMPYVRIDWYEINKQLKFGEITLIPNSGMYIFNEDWTRDIDQKLGDLITIY